MKKIILAFMFVCPALLKAQPSGDAFRSFIPAGWELLAAASGDLNKDSIDDVAIIIEERVGSGDFGKLRNIMILFRAKDGKYSLACKGEKAVMGSESGGTMGDGFNEMKIVKGVIILNFAGGSRDQWDLTYRYRYQNGDFYMIGATNKGGNGIDSYNFDFNVNTGKMIVVKKYKSNPKKNINETRVVKKDPQPMLKSFEPWTLQYDGGVTF
ncbi:MAG: hypothetical protein HOP08_15120 [Cyclobacteriaceae bacterium]|nr:hypothetical protein [Cyclobacteriaceae bacterium]